MSPYVYIRVKFKGESAITKRSIGVNKILECNLEYFHHAFSHANVGKNEKH